MAQLDGRPPFTRFASDKDLLSRADAYSATQTKRSIKSSAKRRADNYSATMKIPKGSVPIISTGTGYQRTGRRNDRLNFSQNDRLMNNIQSGEAPVMHTTPSEVANRFRRSVHKQTLGPDGRINVLARNNVQLKQEFNRPRT